MARSLALSLFPLGGFASLIDDGFGTRKKARGEESPILGILVASAKVAFGQPHLWLTGMVLFKGG